MPELGAQQVADGDEVGVGPVALGPCLGGLDLGVEGFHLTVGQAAVEVAEDALQVRLHGGCELLERRQPAPQCPRQPPAQQRLGRGPVVGPLRQASCRPDRIHPWGQRTSIWLDTEKHSRTAR